MYIYYCTNCDEYESFEEITGDHVCSVCHKTYLPLKVSVDDWNNMTNDEMLEIIRKAKNPTIKKPVIEQSKSIEEQTSDKEKQSVETSVASEEPIFKDEERVENNHFDVSPSKYASSSDNSSSKKSKSTIVIISVCVGLLAIVAAIAIIEPRRINKNKYERILSLEQENKYDEALELCKEIPDYLDVSQIKSRIENEKNAAKTKEIYDQLTEQYSAINSANASAIESMIVLSEQCQDQYDVKDIQQDCYTKLALHYYDENNPEKALPYFNKLESDKYTEFKEQCETAQSIRGTFCAEVTGYSSRRKNTRMRYVQITGQEIIVSDYFVLEGGKLSAKGDSGLGERSRFSYKLIDVKDGAIEVYSEKYKDRFYVSDGILYLEESNKYSDDDKVTIQFEPTNDITASSIAKDAPEIGMTREQALSTEWGKPKKVNTTEYAWGTSEQWCYDNYKYVYLDNGIVTSVQY